MKKYIITGSLGHISRPLIEDLVKAEQEVRVITSTSDRASEIERLGATALVGKVQDSSFLKSAFKGVDAIYTMIPPIWHTSNWRASMNEVATNYTDAIRTNNIQHVVNLSSIGAHLGKGTGPVDGLHDFEQMLNKVPGVNVKHLRPSYFYYNFFTQINLIKTAGFMGTNYGDQKLPLVHTNDIAAVAAEELLTLKFIGISSRYIIGDERSGKEVAQVLGSAISKDLTWVLLTDEAYQQGLLQAGLPETHAENFTAMGKALRDGSLQADAQKNKPVFSPTKLEDFAPEFAAAFLAEEVVGH